MNKDRQYFAGYVNYITHIYSQHQRLEHDKLWFEGGKVCKHVVNVCKQLLYQCMRLFAWFVDLIGAMKLWWMGRPL